MVAVLTKEAAKSKGDAKDGSHQAKKQSKADAQEAIKKAAEEAVAAELIESLGSPPTLCARCPREHASRRTAQHGHTSRGV